MQLQVQQINADLNEHLLELLARVVDEELLEAIAPERLEPKDVDKGDCPCCLLVLRAAAGATGGAMAAIPTTVGSITDGYEPLLGDNVGPGIHYVRVDESVGHLPVGSKVELHSF